MTRAMWAVLGVLLAQPAWAQSTYVAGAIGAEIMRSFSMSSGGSTDASGNGEAWSCAIRAGTFIAPRYGVELEFLRPGAIQVDDGVFFLFGQPVPTTSSTTVPPRPSDVPSPRGSNPTVSIVPPPIISQVTHVRTTTLSTLAFVRQELGARADLVYLGGIGFSRVVDETEYGTSGQPFTSRTTKYGVGPVVGAEARIAMTTHARLVAGIRLHALGESLVDGWLVRPGLGLSWSF